MIVKLELTRPQINKLKKGKAIRINRPMYGTGMYVDLDESKYKKLHRAMNNNKGMNLSLSESELNRNRDIEGEGIFGKRGDKLLKEIGIKKKAYKVGDVIKPAVKYATKKAVNTGVATAVTAATGNPVVGKMAAEVVSSQVNKGIDKFYDDPEKYYGKISRAVKGGDLEYMNKKYRNAVIGGAISKPRGQVDDYLPPYMQSRPDLVGMQLKYTSVIPHAHSRNLRGNGLYA